MHAVAADSSHHVAIGPPSPRIRPSARCRVTRHVYVDESKRGGYLLVASMHPPGELAEARSLMRGLVLKGQRRVHMTKESDPRRKVIVATLVGPASGRTSTTPDAATAVNWMLARPASALWSMTLRAIPTAC